MELRSCNHLHFIKAVRGGLLIKVLNVYQGMPVLKFKKIKDIYEIEDAKKLDSPSTTRPKDEFEVFLFDCEKVKVESSCMPMLERRTIKNAAGSSKFNCNGSDNGRNSGLDDLSFGSITLKQIKERCKAKRKRSNSFDLSKETVETSSCVKQEYSDLQAEEDEFDLKESLSSWKSRLSKKSKTKRKRTKNCLTMFSQCALSIVKSEHIPSDEDFLLSGRDMPALLNIKVEALEPGYSDCQDMICVAADSSLNCNEQVGSRGVVSSEVLKTASECALETGVSNSSTRDAQSCVVNEVSFEYLELADPNMICVGSDASFDCNEQVDSSGVVSSEVLETNNECISQRVSISSTKEPRSCVVNEVSHEYLELPDPKMICAGSESSFGCDEQVDSCGLVSSEVLKTANKCVLETSTKEQQCCVVNEASYEYLELPDPKFVPNTRVLGWEVMEVCNPEIASCLYSDLPVSDFKDEGYVTHPLPQDVYPDTVTPFKDGCTDMHDKCHNYSSELEMSWQKKSNTWVQVPNMAIDNSLQYMEHRDGGDAYVFKDTDDLPSNPEASSLRSSLSDSSSYCDSDPCSSPHSHLVSVTNESPTAEEKHSLMSAYADAARNCSTGIYYGDAIDDLMASSVVGNHHHLKLQHPPERLLSTRKAISPTTQERLCKAMEFSELHYEEHCKSRRKLCSGKHSKNNISRAEGPYQISGAEVTLNPKQILKKPKNDKKGSHPKGSLNVPHHSHTVQRFSTGCDSIQSCSQNAITFSQRQMHDIECLTMKLTKQLKFMKNIVARTWHSEACPATSLKYNADEVKMAIDDTTRIGKSARRWLSIMTKDCDRFCKIMKLTEKGSVTSGNAVRKERKISFADEAGGKLCDIKFFKDDMASPLEPNSEKQELQVE